jgi:hypothetical protein
MFIAAVAKTLKARANGMWFYNDSDNDGGWRRYGAYICYAGFYKDHWQT